MKKIKGYTLLDVLFAMVFTTVVVSMVTTGYSFLMKNSLSFNRSKLSVMSQTRDIELLINDTWAADSLSTIGNSFVLYKDSSIVHYDFSESILREQNGRKDTLAVQLLSFDRQPSTVHIEYEALGQNYHFSIPVHTEPCDFVNTNMTHLGH